MTCNYFIFSQKIIIYKDFHNKIKKEIFINNFDENYVGRDNFQELHIPNDMSNYYIIYEKNKWNSVKYKKEYEEKLIDFIKNKKILIDNVIKIIDVYNSVDNDYSK